MYKYLRTKYFVIAEFIWKKYEGITKNTDLSVFSSFDIKKKNLMDIEM